jgi:hypothetical protein
MLIGLGKVNPFPNRILEEKSELLDQILVAQAPAGLPVLRPLK